MTDELKAVLNRHGDLRKDFEARHGSDESAGPTDYLEVRDGKGFLATRVIDLKVARAKAVAYERLDPIRRPELLGAKIGTGCDLPELQDTLRDQALPDLGLLSAAEVLAYQASVSLLEPFDPKNLKSSSYEVYAEGTVIFWETPSRPGDDGRRKLNIKRGDRLRLPANSIVYVQTEAEFALPLYIAVRYNLRISHVHRGLLLGTGPLVDPGFRGKIFIPLHNLTDSDYWIDTAEALIWCEFTRTSYDCTRDQSIRDALREDKVKVSEKPTAFNERKRRMTPQEYLARANGQEPIRSSIGPGIDQAKRAAEEARRQVNLITIGGVVAFAVAFATFLAAIFAAIQAVDGAGEVKALEQEVRWLRERVDTLLREREQ